MSRASKPLSNLLCVAVLAGLPAASAWAQQAPPPPPRERGNAQDNGGDNRRGSLSDAVRRVERDTRGEVLSAERVQYDGRDMHRVKVVENDGRVRVYLREPTSQPVRQAPPPPPQDPSRERRNGRGNP